MILWSGGCDSTLVLHDALVEEKRRRDQNMWLWPTTTLAISFQACSAIEEQRAARRAIIAALRAKGFSWKHIEVTVNARGGNALQFSSGLSQPQIWLGVGMPFLGSGEPIITGWHDGDHVWGYIADVRAAFAAFSTIGGRKGQLQTPLRDLRKADIIRKLKAAKGLYELTWWCERPTNGKPCKGGIVCRPCKTHALALHEIARFGDEKD